ITCLSPDDVVNITRVFNKNQTDLSC
ncbi:putative exported protein, partial [Chlamydia psittaci 84-8471/1]